MLYTAGPELREGQGRAGKLGGSLNPRMVVRN